MSLRLFNDDFLFRRPLIDRFFDDDDFYLFDRFGDSLANHLFREEEENTTKNDSASTIVAANNTTNTVANTNQTNSNNRDKLIAFHKGASALMGTDLIESEKDYQIHVDVPGVQPEDLNVSIADKYLILQAERKYAHEEKSEKVHSMERSFGQVQRKIRIPQNGDAEGAVVNLRNGVLTVTIPKKSTPTESIRKLAVNVDKA